MPRPLANLRDIIILREGTLLNGLVLNKNFTIKTSFGPVTVKKAEIVHIIMERGLPHELITVSSNILKGRIQDKQCRVRIFTGETITFDLPEEILSLQFLDNLPSLIKQKRAKKG